MKLVVVGGVAGGASAAARVRRLDASAEIKVFDKGRDVSYSNCSLPYYLGGVVENSADLVMMTPQSFKNGHDIQVFTGMEVTAIDRAKHEVTVKDLAAGKEFTESYDKLVLSPGAKPVMPKSIKGIDGPNVFSLRDVVDVEKIKQHIVNSGAKDIVVVGGGFIGIEVAENLKSAGYNVCVVEGLEQILQPYDYDMVQILHKELDDNGVKLYLKSQVTEIGDGFVKAVRDGKEFEIKADCTVMAIGVAPETSLAKAAGLEIGETGGIKVNEHFQTSDPDIYAVGDAIESFNAITGKPGRLALAGPAQRQARAAADHICGREERPIGFIGSSCIKVFSKNAASTGLTEKACKANGLNYDSVLVFPSDKVGLMPDSHYMAFKLIFDTTNGRLLGAQAIGLGEADKRVNAVAALISMGGTIDDLRELELCYSPVYATAKDVVNMAALVATNVYNKDFKQVHVSDVRGLVESGAYIIDVRDEDEWECGHIKTAHNIPMGQLRGRLDEVPKDRPVYLHCRSSQRSYYCLCALRGRGFTNVVNISGSFLGISLYEYFNDKDLGREPIVTAYNFD